MKEKILTLLREMTNDSKSASYKAEKELCNILTGVINKLRTIEEKVGLGVREYPDKIWRVDEYGWHINFPSEIDCNNYKFCFETEWLDINPQEYFEGLKKTKILFIKDTITHVEYSLSEHRRDLQHLEELKFEDLEI